MQLKIMETNDKLFWFRKHPVLTVLGILFIIGFIGMIFDDSKPIEVKTESTPTPTVTQPQTLEDKIKALVQKTGSTKISYVGIDDEKADSDRVVGSRMITVKLNVTSFYDADSLDRNTSELTGKIFQEVFISNPNIYDVIVWYFSDITDKYGNKKNSVLISQAINKKTYEKINWQNFDSAKLCNFLKSEATNNGGETACSILANIK